ncbi:hypothetical protein [Corticimicrobacter sp.]|uniref:hypothetical protein n=1 Tax=Corticimicrobacter sp. TaxID=2678536 RepID=UPI0032DB7966
MDESYAQNIATFFQNIFIAVQMRLVLYDCWERGQEEGIERITLITDDSKNNGYKLIF